MVEIKLEGSGGYVIAELSEELATKSKLVPNVDKYFLAPVGKLEEKDMHKYFCNKCESEFNGPPKYQISKDADLTVLHWKGRVVAKNNAYTKAEFNSDAIKEVIESAKGSILKLSLIHI